MSQKAKGQTGGNQLASNTSNYGSNFTCLAARTKALIVTLAVWGWLPTFIAHWLINKGGMRNE